MNDGQHAEEVEIASAVARALAHFAEQRGLREDNILPRMDEWEVHPRLAVVAAMAAQAQGYVRCDMCPHYPSTLPAVGSDAARRRLRSIATTLENLRVKDAMTCNAITTRPDMPLTQAAALMLEARVGSLPVIENGKLIGIITDRDAVKALALYVPALKYVPEALW